MAEKSDKAAKRRGPGRPFKKGVSGNPGGRPKIENAEELREALKLHAPRAVEVLVEIMSDPTASGTNRLMAASAIFDRTVGKPTQVVDSTVRVSGYMDILARAEEIKKRLNKGDGA